jgi:hypothetical protein
MIESKDTTGEVPSKFQEMIENYNLEYNKLGDSPTNEELSTINSIVQKMEESLKEYSKDDKSEENEAVIVEMQRIIDEAQSKLTAPQVEAPNRPSTTGSNLDDHDDQSLDSIDLDSGFSDSTLSSPFTSPLQSPRDQSTSLSNPTDEVDVVVNDDGKDLTDIDVSPLPSNTINSQVNDSTIIPPQSKSSVKPTGTNSSTNDSLDDLLTDLDIDVPTGQNQLPDDVKNKKVKSDVEVQNDLDETIRIVDEIAKTNQQVNDDKKDKKPTPPNLGPMVNTPKPKETNVTPPNVAPLTQSQVSNEDNKDLDVPPLPSTNPLPQKPNSQPPTPLKPIGSNPKTTVVNPEQTAPFNEQVIEKMIAAAKNVEPNHAYKKDRDGEKFIISKDNKQWLSVEQKEMKAISKLMSKEEAKEFLAAGVTQFGDNAIVFTTDPEQMKMLKEAAGDNTKLRFASTPEEYEAMKKQTPQVNTTPPKQQTTNTTNLGPDVSPPTPEPKSKIELDGEKLLEDLSRRDFKVITALKDVLNNKDGPYKDLITISSDKETAQINISSDIPKELHESLQKALSRQINTELGSQSAQPGHHTKDSSGKEQPHSGIKMECSDMQKLCDHLSVSLPKGVEQVNQQNLHK